MKQDAVLARDGPCAPACSRGRGVRRSSLNNPAVATILGAGPLYTAIPEDF